MTFVMISDKFSEPSLRVVNGGKYDDDDQFEIMNFQIEQWRKKTVGGYNFQHIYLDQSSPSNFPPAWAIFLHLRANSVRALLLRPFFLSSTFATSSNRNIRPGLDLITETIDMIYILDRKTDIYRTHHPCFQHILATCCALMFLIITYVEQNHSRLSGILFDDYPRSIDRNLKKAYALANAYSKSSKASKRLWKRLMRMEQPLAEVGLLFKDDFTLDKGHRGNLQLSQQPDRAASANPTVQIPPADVIKSPVLPKFVEFEHSYSFAGDTNSTPDSLLGVGELSGDWMAPLSEEWGVNSSNGLFWGM